MTVIATGDTIKVHVGTSTLGRVVNALGEPIDGLGDIRGRKWSIYREAPPLTEQRPTTEIFETGIKVIDLLTPYAKGGKIGLFGGAGVGRQ